MNFKRTILGLLSGIFILIFTYNFILPFLLSQNTTGMGMHMNYANYYNSMYFYGSLINFLIIILVIMIVIVILMKLFSASGSKKCRKCGLPIENEDWQICPRCGNPIHEGSVR